MESVRVNSHSVPVLAVNHLEALADFAAGTTMVTQGRSISQAEYDSGAAVCLVSESLARENGLNVGDVLPLSLYEYDQDLRYSYIHEYNPGPPAICRTRASGRRRNTPSSVCIARATSG